MKKIFQLVSVTGLALFGLISCETENDKISLDLGEGTINTNSVTIPVTGFTQVSDTVRSDETSLWIPIGVSNSPVFGVNNASFATSLTSGTGFGINAIGTSVVIKDVRLVIPVVTESLDSDEYNTLLNDATKTTLVKGNDHDDRDTLITTYTVDSIFNVSNSSMDLKVYQLGSKLNTFKSIYYSNAESYLDGAKTNAFSKGAELGSLTIGKTLVDTIYAYYDTSTKKYSYVSSNYSKAGYQIPLNKTVFTNLFNDINSGVIGNQTNFKEKFPGIVIESPSTQGFQFMTSSTVPYIQITYEEDDDTTEGTKMISTVNFSVGSSTDTRTSKYVNSGLPTTQSNSGSNATLYALGNRLSKVIFNIDNTALNTFITNTLKPNGKLEGIISDAYIDLYVDESKAPLGNQYPYWLHFYDNQYTRETTDYTRFILTTGATDIDYINSLYGGIYDATNKRYRIKVTQFIKDIAEGNTYVDYYDTNGNKNKTESLPYTNVPLALTVGQHVSNSFITTANSYSYKTNARYYPPSVAFIGNAGGAKDIKLTIKYTKVNN